MLVPIGRESDWIFCTAAGHLQLLLTSSSQDLFLSRLIFIGKFPNFSCPPMSYTRPQSEPDLCSLQHFQEALFPLLLALCPKAAFKNGVPEIPFLSYEDNVVRSVLVDRIEGPVSGEMLVEDVEIDVSPVPELRRRLRFKMMPNLVQTQPYLAPMVAGLSLVAPFLEEKIKLGLRPRALCLGVGGGTLPMFLQSKLDFDILGVEADPVVLNIARQHFGLVEGEFLHVHIGDAIGFIKNVAQQEDTLRRGLERMSDLVEGSRIDFDVIMVDLDAGDAVNGASAPPSEFVQRSVLLAAKMVLHDRGIIVINVIPQSKAFYSELIHDFHEVFAELYEIEVGNGENYVLVATVTNVQLSRSGSCGSWLQKLKLVIGEKHMNSINKI
ncbi:eEF1A lysine and N-terminal methyltransferase-like [Dioscorea cayenensis subsp. rotundata]|uniref:EEF1A lysine and N-terminal methyltransferase-like n=1 Tax=Dioscorea cayennensis subsp. rotundata TaxID=55577 RepID=A0AB40B9H5_DIOCR|nr:eEF1A lysine and N-terminal methyltransferase-like [Dioscorea cayenensis subsp. rotundata]